MNLLDLPPECHFNILTNLKYNDLAQLGLTNSSMHEASEDDLLWKKLYKNDWLKDEALSSEASWKMKFHKKINWKKGIFSSTSYQLLTPSLNNTIKFTENWMMVGSKTHVFFTDYLGNQTQINNNNQKINATDLSAEALAVGWNEKICIYDLINMKFKNLDIPSNDPSCIKICSGNLVFGNTIGRMGIYNINSQTGDYAKEDNHSSNINCITNHSSDHFFTGAREIKLWDANTAKCIYTLDIGDKINCLTSINENDLIIGSDDGHLRIWDTRQNRVSTHMGHASAIKCFGLSGNNFISGSRDNTVRSWDPRIPRSDIFIKHNDSVTCLQSDGHKVVSGAYDGEVIVKTINGNSYTAAKQEMSVTSLQYDESLLITSFSGGQISLTDFVVN